MKAMFDECLLFNIRYIEQKLIKIAKEEFKTVNLHPTYGYIILYVGYKQSCKVKDISQVLHLSSCTITRMIDKLIQEKILQKGSIHSKVDISLTPKGQELYLEVEKCRLNFYDQLQKKFTKKEFLEINKLIRDLSIKLE